MEYTVTEQQVERVLTVELKDAEPIQMLATSFTPTRARITWKDGTFSSAYVGAPGLNVRGVGVQHVSYRPHEIDLGLVPTWLVELIAALTFEVAS